MIDTSESTPEVGKFAIAVFTDGRKTHMPNEIKRTKTSVNLRPDLAVAAQRKLLDAGRRANISDAIEEALVSWLGKKISDFVESDIKSVPSDRELKFLRAWEAVQREGSAVEKRHVSALIEMIVGVADQIGNRNRDDAVTTTDRATAEAAPRATNAPGSRRRS